MPPATVYEDEASQQRFMFQRQGNRAIAKFPDSPEIMALRGVPAQRGDTYWQNDRGETVFKESELGALTSFVDSDNGAPASVVAYGATLGPPALPVSLQQKQKETAAALSKLAGHEVTVFLGQLGGQERWAAEALDLAVLGVQEANGPAGRAAAKLRSMRLVLAKVPNVTFKDGDLILDVNPQEGYYGLPSSDWISNAITQARSTG